MQHDPLVHGQSADATPQRLRKPLVGALALLVAGVAAEGVFNTHTAPGDPPSSIGHEILSLALLLAAAMVITVLGVRGLRESRGRRGRAAFATLTLGGAVMTAALAWQSVLETTTHHDDQSGGLLVIGFCATIVALVWLAVLSRRARHGKATSRPSHSVLDRYGPLAYPLVFAAFTLLALAAPITGPEGPNAIAVTLGTLVILGWLAARARGVMAVVAPEPTALPADMAPERPGDAATRQYLAPAGEGRITRSWRLTRTAVAVLRGDSTLMAVAAASVLLSVAATVALFWLAGWFHDPANSDRLIWLAALFAWPLTFAATTLNVALAAAADATLAGRHLTVRDALAVAAGRLGQIALWSLLATGVGLVLQQLAERLPLGGRVATWLIGSAWGLVTFFAVPILALEGCTAAGCVRRSTRLIRGRWGEGVGGSIIIGAWAVLAAGAGGAVLGVGLAFSGAPRVAIVAVGLVVVLGAGALAAAIRQIFAVALYRYATDGHVRGGFAVDDLRAPFSARRRLRRPGDR
ncbi:MAG TPA: DUF6159 family protein [Baekduia sp.]|jgi:hypothetical protein|nr:DUF6159 family protein [Baekduia sp.]